jgi:hypothetical protein
MPGRDDPQELALVRAGLNMQLPVWEGLFGILLELFVYSGRSLTYSLRDLTLAITPNHVLDFIRFGACEPFSRIGARS